MLAFLGFLTIILVLALIMSKKSSTLIALIIVPVITGFITAFVTAPQTIIDAAAAKAFQDYLQTSEAQDIWKKYGYELAQ